jgi:hypothetical protein
MNLLRASVPVLAWEARTSELGVDGWLGVLWVDKWKGMGRLLSRKHASST